MAEKLETKEHVFGDVENKFNAAEDVAGSSIQKTRPFLHVFVASSPALSLI